MCYYTITGKITLFKNDLSYLYNLNCILKFAWVYQKKLNGVSWTTKKGEITLSLWALTDSNRRPSACKADALNQLS